MKKFLAIIVIMFALLVSYAPVSYADYSNLTVVFSKDIVTEEKIENEIIDFVYGEDATVFDNNGARVDRTAGSEGEYKAGDYLISKIKSIYGIADGSNATAQFGNYVLRYTTQEIVFQQSLLSTTYTSYNVVAVQDNVTTDDYIVIGAHYDNYYGFAVDLYSQTMSQSHGIYDNASGVSALINLIDIMKDQDLSYDVYYVFFGAEEAGKYGSQAFYQGFVKKYSGDMKLMINLDSIGNGDSLYMYADEVVTPHQKYFEELSRKINETYGIGEFIKTSPLNKKIDYLTQSGDLSYTHMGLNSDNAEFMGKGNNVITFFSGAWHDSNSVGMFESSVNDNMMHSSEDNLTAVKEKYGDVFFARIKQVVCLVANALVQEDFVSMLDESSKVSGSYVFFTNTLYANVILLACLVIVYVTFIMLMKKHKPTAKNESLEKLRKAVLENNIDIISDKNEKSLH